jgi:hypothetical protein
MSKNMILQYPSFSDDAIGLLKERIQAWLETPSLSALAAEFGGKPPTTRDVYDLSKWFLDFCDCWDFRGRQNQAFDTKVGEGARWLLISSDLSEPQKSSALSAAKDLGLTDNAIPEKDAYDYIWVLGGAKLSCLLRSRLALQVVKSASKPPKKIALLASMRPIGDAEREATNTYAPNAKTEFDLFVAAAKKEIGVEDAFTEDRYEDKDNPNNSWVVRKYRAGNVNADIVVIAAPSSEPQKRRANSADTYEFFFNHFHAPEGSDILLTTSQIYVPFQHLEAVRTIAVPHKINLDTIGFPVEWGGSLQGMNEPSNYLQEIRSTIQSIDRFLTTYK